MFPLVAATRALHGFTWCFCRFHCLRLFNSWCSEILQLKVLKGLALNDIITEVHLLVHRGGGGGVIGVFLNGCVWVFTCVYMLTHYFTVSRRRTSSSLFWFSLFVMFKMNLRWLLLFIPPPLEFVELFIYLFIFQWTFLRLSGLVCSSSWPTSSTWDHFN